MKKRTYLNQKDLEQFFENRKQKNIVDFSEWLIAKEKSGDIASDKNGIYLNNKRRGAQKPESPFNLHRHFKTETWCNIAQNY